MKHERRPPYAELSLPAGTKNFRLKPGNITIKALMKF